LDAVQSWPVTPVVLDPRKHELHAAMAEKRAAFRAADVALAASGTVSLELAAARTPMVIAYRMSPISFRLIKWMSLTDTATLVNLVADQRVVPEFLGPDCQPEAISAAIVQTLQHPQAQQEAMNLTMARLGEGGAPPGQRAAKAILSRL
jgi:lipid-A-disaccharide synthase